MPALAGIDVSRMRREGNILKAYKKSTSGENPEVRFNQLRLEKKYQVRT